MRLEASTVKDITKLVEWISNDSYHKDCLNPEWWLTGNGLLSFCIYDDNGPTMFARVEKEGDLLRLHCQFGPETEVSKSRTIKSLLWAIPIMESLARQNNLDGLIYKSTHSSLIKFMHKKFGFTEIDSNDHVLFFEES